MTTHLSVARRRFARNQRATAGLGLLGMFALVAVFAELLAVDAPIIGAPPESSVLSAITAHAAPSDDPPVDEADVLACAGGAAPETRAPSARDERPGLWPVVRWGPTSRTEAPACSAPSRAHPLGTDALGRDLTARVIYGARSAFGLALGVTVLSAALGVALGALAGYYRGFWNARLVRLVETVDTFPAILVVILLRAIEREPSALSLIIAVGLVRWAEIARLVRVEVLRASTADYVQAARALGASPLRIFWKHIAPSAAGPVAVSALFGIGTAVLLEAAVSFLHLGPSTSAASWGETLAEGALHPTQLRLIIVPGLALLVTVGASFLLADALRDALDPRAPPA